MKLFFAVCGLVFFGLAGRPSDAQNLEIVTPKKTTTISLKDMKAKLKSVTIKIDDPLYEKVKEFDGFALADVLHMAEASATDRADELILTAVDGYAPSVTFATLGAHKSFLVYQDHATPGRFPLLTQGKATLSPWPFYLVWEEGAKLRHDVPWPYQLVKIEVVDWSEKYPLVIPQKSAAGSKEMKGFALYKAECIRCHSINLQGGELGPELNAPQNVTEYWKPEVLRAFIQNATSFRYKSKMPNFSRLSSEELDQLIAYLGAMKNFKIKVPDKKP